MQSDTATTKEIERCSDDCGFCIFVGCSGEFGFGQANEDSDRAALKTWVCNMIVLAHHWARESLCKPRHSTKIYQNVEGESSNSKD